MGREVRFPSLGRQVGLSEKFEAGESVEVAETPFYGKLIATHGLLGAGGAEAARPRVTSSVYLSPDSDNASFGGNSTIKTTQRIAITISGSSSERNCFN
jgi:hypothetical protein